tara:strand:- start:2824 stop:4764 length:1941 start_codon:yes stop_codon:yes gene_type:complete
MARATVSQNTFTAGELDPRLAARHDYDGYYKGAQTLNNVVCLGQGGVKRRGGMKYIDTLTDTDIRLVTFEFNVTQTYLLVFANVKMYVYKDGVKQTNLNGSGNDYITTPWNATQIKEVSFTQSADTLIICHNSHAPRKIVRSGSHTAWTLSTITFSYYPTFDFDQNYDGNTFAIGSGWDSVGSDVTVTCNASGKITADHVGGMFEGNGGVVRIASQTSTTLTGKVLKEFVNANTLDGVDCSLEEPVWSATHGYPNAVTFHESRLWMGNSTARPQTLWGSVIGEFFSFDRGVGGDDEALDITLDTDQVNAIYHIISGRHLQIFTSGGEFHIPERPIKPSSVSVLRQTRFGALKAVKPIGVDGATMFIQRNGKQVREFIFTYAENSYVSSEVNLLAPHITSSPVSMASQTGDVENEGNYLFIVNGDGTMGVFITNRAEKVTAWTKYTTSGLIKDVAVVEDIVYVYVQRTINSATVYHIEAIDNTYYTDASKQVTQSSSVTVTGLAHLNGQSCRVRADASVMDNATPSGGSITLARAATNIEVGLNYDIEIKTMPSNITLDSGPISVKKRRISRVSAQLHESSGIKVNGKPLPMRGLGANVLGQAPVVFTGIKSIPILGYSKTAQITVTQTDPLPLTLLGLTLEVQVTG